MKTYDLGKEYEMTVGLEAEVPEKKVSYPSLYLSGVELPPMPVGEDVIVKAVLRKVSQTEREDEDGEDHSCELEVRSIMLDEEPSPLAATTTFEKAAEELIKKKMQELS